LLISVENHVENADKFSKKKRN